MAHQGLTALSEEDYEPPLDVLCTICSKILQQTSLCQATAKETTPRNWIEERWAHHPTRQALDKAASRGCHLCAMLRQRSTNLPLDQQTFIFAYENRDRPRIGCGLLDTNGLCNDSIDGLETHLAVEDRQIQGASRSMSTSSNATIQKARKWLHDCRSQHRECSERGVYAQSGPKRLVVLSISTGNLLQARVRELPVSGPDIEYLTLSYSWGKGKRLKLTRSTYAAFQERIPLDNLPRTLMDAVDITWRLGFRAIWIDALCIIQDDHNDWNTESLKMSLIYGNSICTIASLTGRNSDSGIYAKRDPLALFPIRVELGKGNSFYLESRRHDMIHKARDPSGAPHLHTRGWVVQERAFSPRTLYFSSIDIFWECCSEKSFEPEHSIHRNLADYFAHGRIKSDINRALRNTDGSLLWHKQWWNLVNNYTQCELSFSTDRWPAMSSCAKMFSLVSGSRLMCGMWDAQMIKEIMWETSIEQTKRTQDRPNLGFPSWSWLSNNHPTRLCSGILEEWRNPEYTGAILSTPAPELFNDLGEPKSNNAQQLIVRIRAPMLQCYIRKLPKGNNIDWHQMNSGRLQDIVRQCIEQGRWMHDLSEIEVEKPVWLMQWVSDDSGIYVLLVRPCEAGSDQWRRIGCSHIWFGDEVERTPIGSVQTIDLV